MEAILACSPLGVVGVNNIIPWHLPEDLKYFKSITEHSVVIMGRKTFDSLSRKPLKNRINIVLTRHPEESTSPSLHFIANLSELPEYTLEMKKFIIGGAEIYKLSYDLCIKFYVTIVYVDIAPDEQHTTLFDIAKLRKDFVLTEESKILSSETGVLYQKLIFQKPMAKVCYHQSTQRKPRNELFNSEYHYDWY